MVRNKNVAPRLGTVYCLDMDIAAAIRSRRLELGLTQGEVAFLAGMHRQGVVRLETKGNIPSIATLLRIAAALDLSAVELITSAEEYQP